MHLPSKNEYLLRFDVRTFINGAHIVVSRAKRKARKSGFFKTKSPERDVRRGEKKASKIYLA